MNTLRPDELAAEEHIRRSKNVDKTLKNTALGLGSAALGMGLSNRILPFLNDFIPAELAMKGISKVSPKVGAFLKKGKSMGLDIKEGLNFLKDKMQPKQEKSPLDFIAGYHPELASFLDQHIKNGRQPVEAAALAKMPGKFDKHVRKIEQDTKENFVDLVARLFGDQTIQTQQPQQMQPPQQQQTQQSMQGDDALLAALDKILKM